MHLCGPETGGQKYYTRARFLRLYGSLYKSISKSVAILIFGGGNLTIGMEYMRWQNNPCDVYGDIPLSIFK